MSEILENKESGVAWLGRLSAVIRAWDLSRSPEVLLAQMQLEGISLAANGNGYRRILALLNEARHALRMETVGPLSLPVAHGQVFDYFDEVRKIIELAKQELLFVDPYLDAEFVSRYLGHVSKGVTVRLLAREKLTTLLPAVDLFAKQSGCAIQVRSAQHFHDRYIFVDSNECYQSGASFKDGAKSAPTTLTIAPEPYRTMFAIAAMTGLRVGEVVGLQKEDLDFVRGVINVRRSAWYGRVQTVKSKASAAPVSLSDALATLLRAYLSDWKPNPEGFLFLNRNGRPFAANKVVEFGLWPVLDKLNLPRAGMHAFRHCHASLLMDVGANPTVTRDQMRQSDSKVTMAYSHVIGDAQRDAVNKVGERLRPKSDDLCAQMRPN
jgi:hypothetical protein